MTLETAKLKEPGCLMFLCFALFHLPINRAVLINDSPMRVF